MDTADYWIKTLDLIAHPGLETGYLSKDVFEDEYMVEGTRGHGAKRNAASNIYFLHQPADPFGDETVFFRMVNNEMLNFYRGHALTLYILPEDITKDTKPDKVMLGGDATKGERYFHVIPRNRWFVRRLESNDASAFTLIGCTVVPGYHPDDIENKTLAEIKQTAK